MKSFKMLSNQNSRLRTGWGPAYGPGVLGGCHEPLTPSPSHSQLRTQTTKLWVQMTQWSRQSPSILPSALPRASTSREHGQHTLPPKLAWRLVPAAPASSSSRSLTWSWRGPPLLGSISPARNHCHGLEETPTLPSLKLLPPPCSTDFSESPELQIQLYSNITHWNCVLTLQGNWGLGPWRPRGEELPHCLELSLRILSLKEISTW